MPSLNVSTCHTSLGHSGSANAGRGRLLLLSSKHGLCRGNGGRIVWVDVPACGGRRNVGAELLAGEDTRAQPDTSTHSTQEPQSLKLALSRPPSPLKPTAHGSLPSRQLTRDERGEEADHQRLQLTQ